jgi:cell division septation protein DedD
MAPRQRLALGFLVVLAIGLVAVVVTKARGRAAEPKVTLVAYYPFNESHKPSVDLAQSMAQKFPGKVAVEAYDFTTQEGREKWYTSGLSCAGILVNGKTDWPVVRGGKPETVSFQKREGILWTADDLQAVVKQLIEDPAKPAVVKGKPASATPKAAPAEGEKPAAAKETTPAGEKPAKAEAEAKPAPSGAK